MQKKVKSGFRLFLLAIIAIYGSLFLTACAGQIGRGEGVAQVQNEAQGEVSTQARQRPNNVTPVATRVAGTPTPVASADAMAALNTWNQQTLGINPTITEAKGATRDVLAAYEIVTAQYGIILANIDAGRTGYAGKIQNGGATVLLLGGGSTAGTGDVSVQIKKGSLGYTQLPVTAFPADSAAALTQLNQTFPSLSSYDFKTANTGQNSYIFYATKVETTQTKPPQKTATAVSVGVIKIGNKMWSYALVGTGEFTASVR
jgi:hypothetical protein